MATPIDIIANAIRESCGGQPPVGLADPLANVTVRALTHEDIVANGTRALIDEGWDGPLCYNDMPVTPALLANMVRVVLRSVGGGA